MTERFRGGPAVQRLGAPVPVENALLHVGDTNRVLRLVEQRGLFPDLFFGFLARGDIAGNDDHIGYSPVFVPHHAALRFDKANAAVPGQKPEFGPLPDAAGNRFAEDASNALAVFGVNLLE